MARTSIIFHPQGRRPRLPARRSRHGFLIDVPKGSGGSEMICITEHRGNDLDHLGASTMRHQPNDPALRVVIDRARWLALAPAFWDEANRRLRANGLPVAKFQKNPGKPVPVHPSLGKELCILCWAVEDASPDDIPMPAQLGGPGPRRALVALHHDRGHHRPGHAKGLAGARRCVPPSPTTPLSKAKACRPRPAASCWGIRSFPLSL
jgi:hypothetical protein